MHELSIADAIVRIASRHAAGRPVHKVHVKVGYLRQVVPSSLQFSFELLTDGTALDGAELVIEEVPARGRCRSCGTETEMSAFPLQCSSCGGLDLELRAGAVAPALLLPQPVHEPRREAAGAQDVVAQAQRRVVGVGVAHLEHQARDVDGVLLVRRLDGLLAGQIAFAVLGRNASNEPRRLIGASIGVALPPDHAQHGYLSEYHSFGETEQEAGDYAGKLAVDMLASALGFQPNPDLSYPERAVQYRRAGILADSFHVTQVATGSRAGDWTTTVVAAMMLLGD